MNQLTSTDEWISHMAEYVGQFLWVGGARSRRASVVSLVSPSHPTARAAVAFPFAEQLHSRRALQSELSSCQADTWQGTCAVPAPPPSPPALPLLTCGPGTVYNASSNLCEITCDYSGRRLGEEDADSYLICLCLPGSRTLWRKAPIVTVVAHQPFRPSRLSWPPLTLSLTVPLCAEADPSTGSHPTASAGSSSGSERDHDDKPFDARSGESRQEKSATTN